MFSPNYKKDDESVTRSGDNYTLEHPLSLGIESPRFQRSGWFIWMIFGGILLFVMSVQIFGRNNDGAWYSSTYMTLTTAHANECIPTAASIVVHPSRNEHYWNNAIRLVAEQSAESTALSQQIAEEYQLVIDTILNCTQPCNVLVFGVGWDSMLLVEANRRGRTVFLEDDYKWQQMVRKKVPCMETYLVHYSTRLRDWPLYELAANIAQLEMALPLVATTTPWDVIIVRGPAGEATRLGAWNSPGRMQSLWTASRLAKWYFRHPPRRTFVDVVVFDAERLVEKRFANLFLNTDKNVIRSVGGVKLVRLNDGFDVALRIGND